jgi:hypothetical protein
LVSDQNEAHFLERLRSYIGEPSPLCRSLGTPDTVPAPTKSDAPITRGDACRLLYAAYAPYV